MLADRRADPARRRGPHHPGRARARLPCPARDDRRGVRRRRRGRGRGACLADARRGATSWRARSAEHGRDRPRGGPRRRRSPSSTATRPEHLSIDVARRSRPPSAADPPRGLHLRRAAGRPSPPATTRPARTTSCRPAASPAPAARWRSRRSAGSARSSGSRATAWRRSAPTVRDLAEAEGLLAHRDAVEARFARDARPDGARPMSPTPVTFTSPDRARLVQLGGHRRGRRRALRHPDRADRPVRPEHLADAAGAARRAPRGGPVRDAAVGVPAVGDYRRLVEAAADAYGVGTDELLVGAGADEILDLCAKAFLPAGGRGRRPDADLRDVPRHHRAARRARRSPSPRLGRDEGWAMDLAAVRDGRDAGARTSSGCAARTTRPATPSPRGRSRRCSTALARRRVPRTGAPCRAVVVDEAYARVRRTERARAARTVPEPGRRSDRRARPTRSPVCGSGSRSRARRRSAASPRIGRRARSPPCRRPS